MNFNKLLQVPAITALLVILSNGQRLMRPDEKHMKYLTKFRGVECKNFDRTISYFTYCSVKSYSRTVSALNFGIQIVKPGDINFRVVISYRYGNIYREILDTKIVNWCQIMNGLLNDYNLLFKLIVDMLKQSIKAELFHKCPYEGLIEVNNITINDEIIKKMTVFPEGQYKYNATITDDPKVPVLNIVAFVEIKSPVKSSFG